MSSKFIRGLMTAGLLVAMSLALPSDARAQQRSGVEIWEANCGRCHLIQPTNKYEARDWRSIGIHMGITARLTSAQRDAVIAFLVSGARAEEQQQEQQQQQQQEPEPIALAAPLGTVLAPEQVTQLAKYVAMLAAVSSASVQTSR